jgi:hypothetical protein
VPYAQLSSGCLDRCQSSTDQIFSGRVLDGVEAADKLAWFGRASPRLRAPLGFFLGGLRLYGGDPGPAIILAPVGGLFMLGGVGAFLGGLLRAMRGEKTRTDLKRR